MGGRYRWISRLITLLVSRSRCGRSNIVSRGDRHLLREMMEVCRPAGIFSVPGVYSGISDKIPFGVVMNKGLTIRTGQTYVNRWTDDLLRRIEKGEIDPAFIITHTVSLEEGPEWYKKFRDKEDGCIKAVMKPGAPSAAAAA